MTSVANAVPVAEETFNWSADTKTSEGIPTKDTLVAITASIEPEVLETSVAEKITAEPLLRGDSLQLTQESPVTASVSGTIADSAQLMVEPVMPKPVKSHHTVQAGETLYAIAKMYQIGVMELVNWNKLDLQQGIKPGQVLKLSENQTIVAPLPSLTTSKEVFHEVKSSDTLYSIARQYGVTIKELMDWNQKKDFSLAVGEKLKIQQRQ
jgi:membrane-bound lytic murein transglycosylase D